MLKRLLYPANPTESRRNLANPTGNAVNHFGKANTGTTRQPAAISGANRPTRWRVVLVFLNSTRSKYASQMNEHPGKWRRAVCGKEISGKNA